MSETNAMINFEGVVKAAQIGSIKRVIEAARKVVSGEGGHKALSEALEYYDRNHRPEREVSVSKGGKTTIRAWAVRTDNGKLFTPAAVGCRFDIFPTKSTAESGCRDYIAGNMIIPCVVTYNDGLPKKKKKRTMKGRG